MGPTSYTNPCSGDLGPSHFFTSAIARKRRRTAQAIFKDPTADWLLVGGHRRFARWEELYVSTGRGNAIAIIDAERNEVATTVPVGNRVWGIALDPTG